MNCFSVLCQVGTTAADISDEVQDCRDPDLRRCGINFPPVNTLVTASAMVIQMLAIGKVWIQFRTALNMNLQEHPDLA